MKKIKVFARKLSLGLMVAALAFVALPSNFVFAEDSQELGWEELEPIELFEKWGSGTYCPPKWKEYTEINVKKTTVNNEFGQFKFRIVAWRGQLEGDCSFFFTDKLNEVEENVYEFYLENGQSQKFFCSDDFFNYRIYELNGDDWELVDINGDTDITLAEGYSSGIDENNDIIFTNRKITEEEAPSGENISENQAEKSINDESELAVPNTGKNTGGFSATRTGIVAFAVIATLGRISYLVYKYKKINAKKDVYEKL